MRVYLSGGAFEGFQAELPEPTVMAKGGQRIVAIPVQVKAMALGVAVSVTAWHVYTDWGATLAGLPEYAFRSVELASNYIGQFAAVTPHELVRPHA